MNIPVTQIVEEIAAREHSSYSDYSSSFELHRLWKRSQLVNIPVTQTVEEIRVTQIVEEIAAREHSSYSDCGRDRSS